MRLHDGDHPARAAIGLARGAQDGGDLDRVMAVIVDHRDAVRLAGLGEAPLDAGEAAERTADGLVGQAHLLGDGDGGQRVLHVVLAEHRQAQVDDGARFVGRAVLDRDVEVGAAAVEPEVDGAHVGVGADAVGDDAAVGDARDQRLHLGMVGAQHGEAVERDVLDEAHEGVAQRVEGAVVVEMLGIDVGDDGDDGRQAQEGAVRFVGLDHHPVAAAQPGVGAVGVDDAAVDDRGIEPAGIEHGGDHRGRRRLAVGAADRDRPFQAHQLAQHLGAAHHRQQARAGGQHLGIVLLDRARHDHDLGAGRCCRRDGRSRP